MNSKKDESLWYLIVGTLGIVYGDIGTSPLYAFKKCFTLSHIPVTEDHILGILSLIFWSLFIVVSLKYVLLMLKADNHGEGGILSLTALCSDLKTKKKSYKKVLLSLGILGTALFYGDGVMTPAISVLSALEGLSLISPHFDPYISPLSLTILVLFFLSQKKGSGKIGLLFGPIMILWFLVLGLLGALSIVKDPSILRALNPIYGFSFFWEHGTTSFLTLGSVVLVLTGAEALYADLGHFGKKAISFSWSYLVFPSLVLNYFGQGALLLQNPHLIENPFYALAPSWALSPLILLSTVATIIASQSIISGIFSVGWQGIQLGYFPRMKVIHTSTHHRGQVYVPVMNYILMILTLLAILLFSNSEALASAYGITVTGIMLITDLLGAFLAFYGWKWRLPKVLGIFGPLFCIDSLFLISNLEKFLDGGWFPVSITAATYCVIATWRKGRHLLVNESEHLKMSLSTFLDKAIAQTTSRIPGTGVFMCRAPGKIPSALIIHQHHHKLLFEKMIFLSIVTTSRPKVPSKNRLKISRLKKNIYQVNVSYGFAEVPNLYHVFEKIKEWDRRLDYHEVTFLLSRGLPVSCASSYLNKWEEKLFIFLSHNSMNAIEFFKIPHHRVLELGVHFKA